MDLSPQEVRVILNDQQGRDKGCYKIVFPASS